MIRLALISALLSACHGSRPPATTRASGVTGHAVLAPDAAPTGATGPLFVTWLTTDEKHTLETGQATAALIRDLVTRGSVVGTLDGKRDVGFTVHPVRGRIVLAATVDVSHVGLASVFGAGEGTLQGMSAPFEVTQADVEAPPIRLASQRHAQHELCAGGQLTLEHIEAPEVAGAVGNSTSRRLCVRVPAGYAEHPGRRYPVIYALPGLGSSDEAMLRYELEADDAIIVAVDTSTRTGSTYLVDSVASGQWDRFFTTRLIPFIDAHYRTLPRRSARAITGHSTGGFNAVSYGLRHPELIGVIGASSPDALDLGTWLANGSPRRWIREWQRVERSLRGGGQFISYMADWSPVAAGYEWPFDDAGVLVDGVLQHWLAHSPSTWLRDPARVAKLAPLSGNIYLTVGDSDDFDLYAPTVKFSQQLTAVGIANQLVVTHGGHSTHARDQLVASVAFCRSRLEAAK
jgi:S-formylglutathione hydrolase FrmB